MPLLYDPYGAPIEIAKGRGDLRYSSVPVNFERAFSVAMLGGRPVSYAHLHAEQPLVAMCVMRLLSWSVRVPLKVYRHTDVEGGRERIRPKEHSLARAVVDPWERGSQAQLTQSLLGPLLVHGNGLDEVDEGARGTIRFNPTDWRCAQPIMPFTSSIAGWTITEDDEGRTAPADTMLHVAWWSPLGPLGISPLRQLGVTLKIEDAAQRHQQAMLGSGARPPSAIVTDPSFLGLKSEERALLMSNLRSDITDIYGGPENSGKPAILPPGLDWKPIGHTAVEAQLVEQRIVDRQEAGAVYMLPPGVLGFLDKGGDSLAEQRQMAYMDGLAPPLILIEQAINAQLVTGLLRETDIFVEYDFAGILRGDRLKEIQALREAIASALMTPNEGRGVLNLPRSDQAGTDDLYLPRNNLIPLSVPYQATGMHVADPGTGVTPSGDTEASDNLAPVGA